MPRRPKTHNEHLSRLFGIGHDEYIRNPQDYKDNKTGGFDDKAFAELIKGGPITQPQPEVSEDLYGIDERIESRSSQPLGPIEPINVTTQDIPAMNQPTSVAPTSGSRQSPPAMDQAPFPADTPRPEADPTPQGKDWQGIIENLRKQGKDDARTMMILKGLQQIATAPARSVGRSDYSGFDRSFDQAIERAHGTAERGVADIMQKRQFDQMDRQDDLNAEQDALRKQFNDPSSEVSDIYRGFAERMMPGKDFSKFSAQRLQETFPLIEKLWGAEMAQQLKEMELAQKQGEEARKIATEYRKEFNQLQPVQEFRRTEMLWNQAQNTPDSFAGDRSLVESYLKMIDPQARVRDDGSVEFAGDQSLISGVPAQVWNSLAKGDALQPRQRDIIRQSMDQIFEARQQTIAPIVNQYAELSSSAGVNPRDVIQFSSPQSRRDPQIAQYAEQNNLDYNQARTILINRGYQPNE